MSTGAGYATGDLIANIAETSADGELNSPVSDQADLYLSGSCIQNCEGTVYATGFTWSSIEGQMRVDATCVSEATCGDSQEWPAQPAEMNYLQEWVTLQNTSTSFEIVGWDGNPHTINVDFSSCGPTDEACVSSIVSAALEAYDV
ncbi:MAG: hypothetical protein H6765_10515 [Candidatus Peribacteria bacterium]|nr:MAG: hypothetical protein H6765_10515 [Candidatus Peribacteria bacterium]